MYPSAILSVVLLAASAVDGHTIFQRLRVNGVDQGQLVGVRAPSSNNPVTSVTGSSISCNTGLRTPVSTAVVRVAAGASVGAWFQHVIGGPQGSNDPDNPIASSHKGPIIVYMAKVNNAGTSGTSGLNWFKVAQEGLNNSNGRWAVDTMISGGGWWTFRVPSCLAPGQYLMRVELIALHNAYSSGGAQFYLSCANIQVTGTGTKSPSSFVQFPGAYAANNPGILLNIYSGSTPNNGGRPYPIPGPSVFTC